MSDSSLDTQSTLKLYQQKSINGHLVESNPLMEGSPAVIVTPIVIKNVQPNGKQSIRLLAIKQNPDSEIAYRYYVKNLNPRTVDSSGTNFEIEYGMPIFVLPQNVRENYEFSYLKSNNKSYIKVTNTGNVHVLFKEVYFQNGEKKVPIGSIGRLLSGSTAYVEIPPALDKSAASQFTINVAKGGLLNIDQESQVSFTIRK